MKTNTQSNHATKAQANNSKRPENKNNLDSREGEEQLNKGDDTTHNKKETQSSPKKK